jgi:NADPH:quinone reductase-like Zn-dependent oxidoreductase
MSETMWAVRLHAPGGLEGLAVEEVERPAPAEGEVLVRVHAAAITRDELDWPVDRLPAIPSYELSGVVVTANADGFAPGDPVWALTPFDRDGVAAEYAAVPAAVLAAKPETLTHVEAAAVPLPALSAWQALFHHGGLEPGGRVLVLGATGGVGQFGMQLARSRGAQAFGEEAPQPVELVFDTVGGERLTRAPEALAEGGRIVTVAEAPPEGVEADYFVVEPNSDQLAQLADMAGRGELEVAIDSVYPLAEARAAFERSMARGKRGKVVLRVVDD